MTRPSSLLVVLLVSLAAGCKNTEDYLNDLETVYDRTNKRVRPDVYDGGQLVHEAFAGLAEQEVITLSQLARGIAQAGYVVAMDRDVIPLCQTQAVYTLARLAVRYPVPPVTEAYEYTDRAQIEDIISAQIQILGEQQDRMGMPAQIALMNSPDRAIAEKAHERLVEVAGADYGRTAGAWESWWGREGAAARRDAAAISEEPLALIGQARFTELTQAAAVLNFVGLHVALFDMPELRETQRRTVLRLARQVVVLGIDRALRRADPMVRGAAGQAAARVLDPAHAPALLYALQRESDPVTRGRLIEALAHYPGREAILLIMAQLRDDDRSVNVHAHRALVAISGEDFGSEIPAWQLWWDQTGKARWP